MADSAAHESVKDFGTGKTASVGRWLAEIKAYERTFDAWHQAADRAIKRYRNESDTSANALFATSPRKFNIFWSNVQTLQPALYSRTPKADITRAHKDRNPSARGAAVILERATREELQYGGFDDAMRAARDDYLLTARGQVWVRYVPTYGEETKDRIFLQVDTSSEPPVYKDGDEPVETFYGEDGKEAAEPLIGEDQQPYTFSKPYKPVVSECVKVDHINFRDFGHTLAPKWEKVTGVWKNEAMTRSQIVTRFGKKKGEAVALTLKMAGVSEEAMRAWGDTFKRGLIHEIWDKDERKVLWISPGYTEEPLDEINDPLHLTNFFPCPKPLYGTLTTDSLIPIPDYEEYRAQAEEIDLLTERIRLLTKALKVVGAYDAQLGTTLQEIFKSEDNTMVPVDNWAMFGEKGGVAGSLSFLPIKEIADAIVSLTKIRDQAKSDLFEVSGLSDLVRGQGNASATATAESIKGQYAGMRMEDRQALMGRFARETVQIVAEIIAEHFSPETLWEISGWEFTEEARAMDKAVEKYEKQAAMAMVAAQQPMVGMRPPNPMGQSGTPLGGMNSGLPTMPPAPAGPPLTQPMPPQQSLGMPNYG